MNGWMDESVCVGGGYLGLHEINICVVPVLYQQNLG